MLGHSILFRSNNKIQFFSFIKKNAQDLADKGLLIFSYRVLIFFFTLNVIFEINLYFRHFFISAELSIPRLAIIIKPLIESPSSFELTYNPPKLRQNLITIPPPYSLSAGTNKMPKTPTDSQESQSIFLKETSDFEKIEYNSALFDIGLIFQKNIIDHYADA